MSKKWFIFFGLSTLFFGSILLTNNLEIFRKSTSGTPRNFSGVADEQPDEVLPEAEEALSPPAEPDEAAPLPDGRKDPFSHLFSFRTDRIICPLRTEDMLYVVLQADLRYPQEAYTQELKFRKGDIEGVIQNILYNCEREELTAPLLRRKLITALNSLLKSDQVQDISFTDFKIEIRKK